jgi:threonine dehydratase
MSQSADAGTRSLTAGAIETAARNIQGHVRRTPVLRLEGEQAGTGSPVWLKLESLQVTGSFKARNAFALLLGADVPASGVVAVSGGNFGLAIAHAARRLGHRATIFVPDFAPTVKIDAIRAQGADVEVVAGSVGAAFAASERRISETGALFAHPYDQVEVMAGAGTCGLEFDEQCPDLDTVLIAVGGGGLIGGVATWFADRTKVVAVETEGTATLHSALAAGDRVEVEPTGVAASALGASVIGEMAWDISQRWVDDSIVVSDEAAVAAQRRLWDAARVVAEPGGAVAFAALTSGAYVPGGDETVGVIVCGANTDPGAVSTHAAHA